MYIPICFLPPSSPLASCSLPSLSSIVLPVVVRALIVVLCKHKFPSVTMLQFLQHIFRELETVLYSCSSPVHTPPYLLDVFCSHYRGFNLQNSSTKYINTCTTSFTSHVYHGCLTKTSNEFASITTDLNNLLSRVVDRFSG